MTVIVSRLVKDIAPRLDRRVDVNQRHVCGRLDVNVKHVQEKLESAMERFLKSSESLKTSLNKMGDKSVNK